MAIQPHQRQILTGGQAEAVLRTIDHDKGKLMALLMIHFGIRTYELLSLRAGDLDLGTGMLVRQGSRLGLTEKITQTRHLGPEDALFTRQDISLLRYALAKAGAACYIPYPVTPKVLRQTYIHSLKLR